MTSPQNAITLYNTMTREKQPFTPIDAQNVRMYACGPTVYDFAHIGNGRMVTVFDVLFRLLRHTYGADHVTYVRNITDVEDKINARAAHDYPDLAINDAIAKLTGETNDQFQADVTALGNLEPSIQPRATQHIPQMQAIITSLIKKGHAYEANGEVLFDVTSMAAYGALSNRNLDDQQAGARVAVEAHKKNPGDFVLWKSSGADQPGWESPWGDNNGWGRPGWHIECSAMAKEHLGDVFDIHGGGIDLVFPHHENEIAQSCCANGTETMANIWMHNGYLNIEGEKMSKSLGNFFTINDLLTSDKCGGRPWPGDVLRLAILMTHYREPIDFSVARLEEAEKMLTRWKKAILSLGVSFTDADRAEVEALGPCSKLVAALSNDLNMSGAIAELHRHAGGGTAHNGNRLFGSLQLLGLVSFDSMQSFIAEQQNTGNENVEGAAEIGAAVEARLEALNAKNFAKADEIRNDLSSQGVKLTDSKDSATGERVTTWEMA